jgi:hypothetical protein
MSGVDELRDIVLGCVLVGASLAAQVFLVLWSRRSINRIARRGYASARKIASDEQRPA